MSPEARSAPRPTPLTPPPDLSRRSGWPLGAPRPRSRAGRAAPELWLAKAAWPRSPRADSRTGAATLPALGPRPARVRPQPIPVQSGPRASCGQPASARRKRPVPRAAALARGEPPLRGRAGAGSGLPGAPGGGRAQARAGKAGARLQPRGRFHPEESSSPRGGRSPRGAAGPGAGSSRGEGLWAGGRGAFRPGRVSPATSPPGAGVTGSGLGLGARWGRSPAGLVEGRPHPPRLRLPARPIPGAGRARAINPFPAAAPPPQALPGPGAPGQAPHPARDERGRARRQRPGTRGRATPPPRSRHPCSRPGPQKSGRQRWEPGLMSRETG